KRVMYDDADILDRPLKLAPGQRMRDVQVVFSDRRSELTLQVTDEHDIATREYVALVFSRDRAKWTDPTRFVRVYVPQPVPPAPATSRPIAGTSTTAPSPVAGTTGTTAVAAPRPERSDAFIGLPPGDYYIVALDDLAVEGWRDPAVLETFVAGARSFTVGEDEKMTISLKRRTIR